MIKPCDTCSAEMDVEHEDIDYCDTCAAKLSERLRRLSDPNWANSDYQLHRLANWFYEYEGIRPRSDKETVELVTMRYLELRKLASSKLTRPVFLTEAEEYQALCFRPDGSQI